MTRKNTGMVSPYAAVSGFQVRSAKPAVGDQHAVAEAARPIRVAQHDAVRDPSLVPAAQIMSETATHAFLRGT